MEAFFWVDTADVEDGGFFLGDVVFFVDFWRGFAGRKAREIDAVAECLYGHVKLFAVFGDEVGDGEFGWHGGVFTFL